MNPKYADLTHEEFVSALHDMTAMGMTYDQISEETNVPKGTIGFWITKIRHGETIPWPYKGRPTKRPGRCKKIRLSKIGECYRDKPLPEQDYAKLQKRETLMIVKAKAILKEDKK